LREVLAWEPGTQVIFNCTPESPVMLRSGGVAMFKGKVGQRNNHIAVKIESRTQKE
jgi:flagellar motor switch protein FliM